MFASAAAGLACAMLVLDAASGRHDLLARAGAHLQPAHGDRALDPAVGEHLRRPLAGADDARLDERLRRRLGALGQPLQVLEPHQLVGDAERVGEAALRDAARQRHLAALELRLAAARAVMARARLAALVPLARRLAGARAATAAEPPAIPVRATARRQVVEPDLFHVSHVSHSSTGVTFTRCRTCLSWPRSAGESCCTTMSW